VVPLLTVNFLPAFEAEYALDFSDPFYVAFIPSKHIHACNCTYTLGRTTVVVWEYMTSSLTRLYRDTRTVNIKVNGS